ncbi:exocyst complex component EXO84A-like [Dendrobium catenatum]|uniref:exocyst complex component EXO84A-like n=1 Tax=Dendrobium catenatum TaxID=906689 RepID=UPI0009F34BBB|nr:exocyst complex component EXO84A-like [Dendrobium catenatum]
MDSPSLSRFDYQDADEYQSAEEAIEISPDSESEGYELEMESITGKGINRLCSELLELKKASDEDFLKNIYSNYSAFMRIFEEFEGIESEILKMKNHVSTQNMLVEEFMNSFHSEIILEKLENLKDECVEDLDLDFPTWMETRMQNILETLDILMSEHRMEEALVVLEKETQNMQKLLKEKDGLLPIISSFAYAISELQTALAEQFTSLAGHRRVTWPELHNALFGLCRLGESDRAIVLLLNFYHLQLENSVKELKCSAPFPHETYTLELTKVVFSTISQATRSFVLLFGEASPYTLDLMQWTRVELEVIYHSFDMSVKSMSETSFALGLAVEIMNISFSFCSLLEQERLSLRADVIKLMKPCITEVLKMHFDQLRKVVSLFASTDNWVLGKFPFSEKFSNKSPLMEINGKLEYLQLTSSGRKFITLMQIFLLRCILAEPGVGFFLSNYPQLAVHSSSLTSPAVRLPTVAKRSYPATVRHLQKLQEATVAVQLLSIFFPTLQNFYQPRFQATTS